MEAQPHQVPYVLQLILDLIQRFNIQSPEFYEQMMPYTGTRTNHFQHEFYNFARSTYDMIGYDRNAMYSDVQPVETYVVSSDSSSSSSDENDIHVESTHASASNSNQDNNELIVVDDSTPQPVASRNQNNIQNNHQPVASTSNGEKAKPELPFPLIISSGESDGNVNNDVEIVNYVKPRKDRTPVIVNIESSDEDAVKKEKPNTLFGNVSPKQNMKLPVNSAETSPNSAITSLIPLTPPASNASTIVVIDDSSPETQHVGADKPLWKRNFENCFPNEANNSDYSKKSKRLNEGAKRKKRKSGKSRKRFSSPIPSSDSDFDISTINKEIFIPVNTVHLKHCVCVCHHILHVSLNLIYF